MKNIKKTVCLLVAVLLVLSFCGCSVMSLNAEKDLTNTVAKVNGQKYTKQEFLTYYDMAMITYETYGYNTPQTEEDTKIYKQDILDEFVLAQSIKLYCEENGIKNTNVISDGVDEIENYIKLTYDTDESYAAYLEGKGYTPETFDTAMTTYLTLNNYMTAFYESKVDHSFLFNPPALTVGETEIPDSVFYYYTVVMLLQNYANNQTMPSTDDELLAFYDNIKTYYLPYYYAINDYGEKNGYTVNEEEIATALSSLDMLSFYFGENTLNSYFENYFISDEQVEEAKQVVGKLLAMETKVSADIEATYEPTDEELTTYYEDGKDTTFGEKVSAYHILVADEERAKELYAESKGTAEGFMKIYEKYSATDNADTTILEAADLGAFYYSAMVQEFSSVAFSMKKGEVKGMVKSEYGYHLIYVYDKSEALTLEDNRDEIVEAYLAANSSSYAYDKMDEIYKDYKVKDGDYRKTPQQRLNEWMEKTYSVKTYPKIAVR